VSAVAPPERASAEPPFAPPAAEPRVPVTGPEGELLPERSPVVPAADYAARLAATGPGRQRAGPGVISRLQAGYGNAYAVELISRLRSQPGNDAERAATAAALAPSPPGAAVTTPSSSMESPAPGTDGLPAPEMPAATGAPPSLAASIPSTIDELAAEAPAPGLTEERAPFDVTGAAALEPDTQVLEAEPVSMPEIAPVLEAEPEPEPELEVEPTPPEPEPPAEAPAPTAAAAVAEPGDAAALPAPEPPTPAPAGGTPEGLSGEEAEGGEAEMPAAEDAAEEPAAEAPLEAAAGEVAEGEALPEAEAESEAEKTPSSPEDDRAYQAVLARARAVARSQGHNNPAQRKAAEAQAAAPGPDNELEDAAAGQQVSKMGEQEPAPFDKEKFKRALMEKVAAITPRNLEEADDFKDSGKAASIKGDVASQVTESKEGTEAPVKETAAETPDTGSVEPKPVEPLPPTDPGAPPPDIGAEAAAPKPKSESEVSLAENSREIEDLSQSSDPPIDEAFVERSKEPDFKSAYDAKQEAQQDAAERPAEYREQEQAVLASAQQQAAGSATSTTEAMHQTRHEQFASIVETQAETQTEDQTARDKILRDLRAIYDETKAAVEERLDRLDEEVSTAFDAGAEAARLRFENYVEQRMRAYKRQRYSGLRGGARWLKDKLLGMPDEVNVFYTEGRELYVNLMEGVVDQVAGIVAAGLNEAMALIAAGRQRVQDHIANLPAELQVVGQSAADEVQADFDNLAQDVADREDRLVDSLAQRYADNLAAIDARIEEMQAANRGLVDAALDAVKGVIDTIIELKNMLLGVLSRAADVIGTIISDPIGFLGNLIAAVRLGLDNFIGNIGTHLQQVLMGWLFGTLAEAGIQMPESFDLKGILSLVLQVLGLTYANIRARAVRIVGEPVVAALERAAEVFQVLIREGPGGLWEYIKDKLANMRDMVIEGVKSFVMERIIVAGITWLIGLLNPAAAFIKACKMIYDIVMFFVTRGSQIMALVNAILDSIAAIASGAIGGAAAAVEGALGRAIPVVIGFLASLLGLGGISQKIREIIQRIQAPVNAAIDWVINMAVRAVQAVGNLFGGRRDQRGPETDDPEHDARVTAALAAIGPEEQKLVQDGKVSEENAARVAATVKQQHPILSALTPKEGDRTWQYEWRASPGGVHTGTHERIGNLVIRDISEDIPAELRARLEAAGSDWEAYETAAVFGVTKEVLAPEWAEETGIPFEMAERGGRASAQYMSRLRVQRGHRARGIGTVRPEATMEVMVPLGRGALQAVYKVEATLVEDYSTSVHKMTQLYQTGSTIKAKYGTTVPIQYHIISPKRPPEATIEEVNNAIDRIGIPNVTVVWNITG
jgi:hypothetical protein